MPFTLTPAEKDAAMTPEALLTSHRRHRRRVALACVAALLATAGAMLMSVAPATALTPGRHYEQVTPVDKAGETAWPSRRLGRRPAGALATGGGNGLPGFPSFRPVFNTLLAARGDTAWQAVPANGSAITEAYNFPWDVSPDAPRCSVRRVPMRRTRATHSRSSPRRSTDVGVVERGPALRTARL